MQDATESSLSYESQQNFDIDRAVRLGTEMARNTEDEQLGRIDIGPEALAYATDRLTSKIKRDAVYNPVGEVYSGLLSYGFLKKQLGSEKVIYHHNRQLEPKPPAPTDDWLVDYVRRNSPLTLHRWRELFPRRTVRYAFYRFERLWRAERLCRSWMPDIAGVISEPLYYAPRLPTKGGRP
jgi:hypothetical protein